MTPQDFRQLGTFALIACVAIPASLALGPILEAWSGQLGGVLILGALGLALRAWAR